MNGDEVVIIGVGQLRNNRERDRDAAREPLDLALDAAQRAAADAGLDAAVLAERLGSVDVVQIVSWSYDDAAAELAARLGATRAATTVSGVGGHQPVARLHEIARRLADGDGGLALLVGAEAQSSVDVFAKADEQPPWSRAPGGPAEFPREVGGTERMWELGLVAPIRVYPLFENRLRHDLGQTFAESHDWSARMYADFSRVAASNAAAWDPTERSADEIATVGDRNRMICFPYPLRMNANNRVDQAAAVLVATRAVADELGIPAERRVAVVSGAGASDSEDVLERSTFGASPGLAHTLDRTLQLGGVDAASVDVLDLYSCFPVVPKLAALHLKAGDRPLSVTGGLSSFGGAHNDYSTHALAAAVRALRHRPGTALVYANGEYLTRHAAVLLSSDTSGQPPALEPDPGTTVGPAGPAFADGYEGTVEVETYTVEYGRDATPVRAYVVARTPDGTRTAARVSRSDTATLARLVDPDGEPVGTPGCIEPVDGRRYFTQAS